MPTIVSSNRQGSAMPPTNPAPGNLHAIAKIVAAPSFLILLCLTLHFTRVFTIEEAKSFLRALVGIRDPEPPPAAPGGDNGASGQPGGGEANKVRPAGPSEPSHPTPKRPPTVKTPATVEFVEGQQSRTVKVEVDSQAAKIDIDFLTADRSLVPPTGFRRDGSGKAFELTITPAAGAWGDTDVTVRATDPDGLKGEAVIRVSVPRPPVNQPPRLTAEPRLVFGKGERVKVIELGVKDETPATGLTFAVTSSNPALLPPAAVARGPAGLTVTPVPGKWGEAVVTVAATDPEGLTGTTSIRVVVPEPGFALAALADVTVTRGQSVSPIPLRVTDDSPVPAKVTFSVIPAGPILPAGSVKLDGDRLVLSPDKGPKGKGVAGAATVTVVASAADGREDRNTFKLTVTPPPPPEPAKGVKARVTPASGAQLISSGGESTGGANLGVPDLARGTEVLIDEVRGPRVCVTWRVGTGSYRGWLDRHDLTTFEE